jgi:hypothetical protein
MQHIEFLNIYFISLQMFVGPILTSNRPPIRPHSCSYGQFF